MKTWLWPDRAIGKRESRALREEHNATINVAAELLNACENVIELFANTKATQSDIDRVHHAVLTACLKAHQAQENIE